MTNATISNQTHPLNTCNSAYDNCTTSQPQHVQTGLIVGLILGVLAFFIFTAVAIQCLRLRDRKRYHRRSDSPAPEPMQQQEHQHQHQHQTHQHNSSTDSQTPLTLPPSPISSLHAITPSIRSQPVSALSRQSSQVSSVHQTSVISALASPTAGSPVTDRATAFNFSRLSVPQTVQVRRSVVDIYGAGEGGSAVVQ